MPKISHHRNRKRGNTNSLSIERINVGSTLGHGYEAAVHEASVVFVSPKRKNKSTTPLVRTREMAVKKFFPFFETVNPSFRFPLRHVRNHEWLTALNREHKLGLHIIPTLRIIQDGKKRTLLKTKLPMLPPNGLSPKQQKEFKADRKRQIEALKKMGVRSIWKDLFYPVIDTKTMKCIAVINDFGTLYPKETTRGMARLLTQPLIQKWVGMSIRRRANRKTTPKKE